MSEADKNLAKLSKHVIKALTPLERPLDAQEARSIIMLTHRIKTTQTFWQVCNRKLLTINRFSAWKFCNLLHKILRDGSAQALRDALSHRDKLLEILQYWACQQQEHMGQCIAWYCKVLLTKLQFHDTYIFFTGNFNFSAEHTWDANICFQLCSDIFDLLECLLQLQYAILTNIAVTKLPYASMQAKCRLSPLVAIVDECEALYYHAENVLRMLCLNLPPEDVLGLRERFNTIFDQLQGFYINLRSIQVINEFIQIPKLPASVPTFFAQAMQQNLQMPSAPSESDFEW